MTRQEAISNLIEDMMRLVPVLPPPTDPQDAQGRVRWAALLATCARHIYAAAEDVVELEIQQAGYPSDRRPELYTVLAIPPTPES